MNQKKHPKSSKYVDFYIIINRRTRQSVDKKEYDNRTKAENAMNEREDRDNLTIASKRKGA